MTAKWPEVCRTPRTKRSHPCYPLYLGFSSRGASPQRRRGRRTSKTRPTARRPEGDESCEERYFTAPGTCVSRSAPTRRSSSRSTLRSLYDSPGGRMNPTYEFHDRVAVVTGAGSGMGLATAQAFAESGAAVVLADRNEQALRTATAELTSADRQALGVVCDVSDEAQVAALIERTVDTFGRLDFAFNNAGIQAPPTDAADEPAET